ncbi:ABC transporter permease [Krasilnikovia sp. MM14-A1259]|uniref:ABC transporter permease n=1 Tax=Krasilnikovia sp. MM14-A1259 TaxID=3373539 RepID=UPI00382A2C2B
MSTVVSRPLWQVGLAESARCVLAVGRLAAGIGIPLAVLGVLSRVPSFRQPDPTFGGASVLDVYLPTLIVFSIGLFALTALPTALAEHRDRGAPGGWAAVLTGRLAGTVAVSAAGTAALLAVASAGLGVPLPRQPAAFLVVLVPTVALLLGAGTLIGRLAPTPVAAQYIGTTLLAAMMFFAGLFGPVTAMHGVLRGLAEATPLGAATQAMQDAWQGRWPHLLPLVPLAAWTALAVIGAVRAFRSR